MTFEIRNNIFWTGKIHWELKKFHGEELSTANGSSYNAYLIKGEKNVLIDTVYTPFAEEFIQNLKKEIDLEKLDYIVINHAEPDHSGALPLLMTYAPNAKIYASANGVKSIKGYYHQDWDITPVKTGDKLDLGGRELVFIDNSMIHWPDSMMCYMPSEEILFSNDAFGQHFASIKMYNSNCDKYILIDEAIKYYANIVAPFSKKVAKKIEEIKKMNINISMICPSHGIIWDEEPMQIVDLYEKWANNYAENSVAVIYDSMYGSTRKMAEAIADGIRLAAPEIAVKIMNTSHDEKSDIIAEVFRAKALIAGSSALNNGILTSVSGILDELAGFALQDKKAAAFGSYGWSPANIKTITNKLTEAGFEIIADGIKAQWNPTSEVLDNCREFGKAIAEKLK